VRVEQMRHPEQHTGQRQCDPRADTPLHDPKKNARKINSSVTAAAAMKPSSPIAPLKEPKPSTWYPPRKAMLRTTAPHIVKPQRHTPADRRPAPLRATSVTRAALRPPHHPGVGENRQYHRHGTKR